MLDVGHDLRRHTKAAHASAAALRARPDYVTRLVPGPVVAREVPRGRACVRAALAPSAPSRHELAARVAELKGAIATSVAVAPVAAELQSVRLLMVERSMQSIAINEDGLGVTGQADGLLRELLAAAQRAFERRFAKSTQKQDNSYWRFWSEWCHLLGTPPLRSNVGANSGAVPHLHQREVALALGAFMSWVTENPTFKVASMLARLRGVARRHKSLGFTFVSLSMVVMAAEGLIQEHIDTHGADSLLPKSKEPLLVGEIISMLNLPPGTVVGIGAMSVTVGDNLQWQGVRVWITLLCTGGFRKEAFAIGTDEKFGHRKLSLRNVVYRRDGDIFRAPTLAMLLWLAAFGTIVYVIPCPCKNDAKGDKYGNSPVPSAWHPTRPICFAREIIRYEIMRRVAAGDRQQEPLVLGPAGVSWTKKQVDDFFKRLLAHVVSKDRARQLSIHSFRVWLACALLAAGATPEQIMLLLRWSSDAARKLYARLGERTQTSLLSAA